MHITTAVASAATATPAVAAPSAGRFAFLDGLRGLAALAVCCYHIERYAPFRESVADAIPEALTWTVRHGWCGVQVFFVISGFVIAYSLRNAAVTPRYLGEFLARRTVRLTPPYLTLVAAGVAVGFAPVLFELPSGCDEPVSVAQVLAHLFYLQNIFGYENLSAGFWTLCIEMQFYALFVMLMAVAQSWHLGSAANERESAWSMAVASIPLGLASLFWWNCDESCDDWVIHFWGLFVAGALVWWVADYRLPAWVSWGYLAAMVLRLSVEWTNELLAAIAAGTVVLAAAQGGGLETWLNVPWLQHLGRISYSLYLVHFPISHLVLHQGYEWTGDSAAAGLGWMALCVVLSLVVAEVFYRTVEAPCVAWSARFKRSAATIG